jgi:hypothetical protein
MQSVTCTDVTVATGITPATALQHHHYVDTPEIDYLVRSHAGSQFNSIHPSLRPCDIVFKFIGHDCVRIWELLDDWDLAKTKISSCMPDPLRRRTRPPLQEILVKGADWKAEAGFRRTNGWWGGPCFRVCSL